MALYGVKFRNNIASFFKGSDTYSGKGRRVPNPNLSAKRKWIYIYDEEQHAERIAQKKQDIFKRSEDEVVREGTPWALAMTPSPEKYALIQEGDKEALGDWAMNTFWEASDPEFNDSNITISRLVRTLRRSAMGVTFGWEDIAQSAFIDLMIAQQKGKFKDVPIGKWPSFVATTFINAGHHLHAKNKVKKEQQNTNVADIAHKLKAGGGELERQLGSKAIKKYVQFLAVDIMQSPKINPKQRAVFAGWVQGKKHDQIAKELNLDPRRSRSIMSREIGARIDRYMLSKGMDVSWKHLKDIFKKYVNIDVEIGKKVKELIPKTGPTAAKFKKKKKPIIERIKIKKKVLKKKPKKKVKWKKQIKKASFFTLVDGVLLLKGKKAAPVGTKSKDGKREKQSDGSWKPIKADKKKQEEPEKKKRKGESDEKKDSVPDKKGGPEKGKMQEPQNISELIQQNPEIIENIDNAIKGDKEGFKKVLVEDMMKNPELMKELGDQAGVERHVNSLPDVSLKTMYLGGRFGESGMEDLKKWMPQTPKTPEEKKHEENAKAAKQKQMGSAIKEGMKGLKETLKTGLKGFIEHITDQMAGVDPMQSLAGKLKGQEGVLKQTSSNIKSVRKQQQGASGFEGEQKKKSV